MSVTKRPSFPLQWPEGWKREVNRSRPKFIEGHFAIVRDSVVRQLERMGGRHVVITSDLPTRADGLPYANARCEDPGIAVYWVKRGHEHVIACDRWRTIGYNLRSIDMTLAAMRGIDRWGSATMVEKAFAGFAALPPGSTAEYLPPAPAPAVRPWRAVFDIATNLSDVLTKADLLALVKSRHRSMITVHHPDKGGDAAIAAELNAALAEAERELQP